MSMQKQKCIIIKLKACRLCLDFERDDNLLINANNDGWFELLEYCIGLKIDILDKPQMICTKCANSLLKFVEFKKQCLTSHSVWESITSDNMVCLMKKQITDSKNNNDSTVFEKFLTEIKICKEESCTSHFIEEINKTFDTDSKDNILLNNEICDSNFNDSVNDTDCKERVIDFEVFSNDINKINIQNEQKSINKVEKKLSNEFICPKCNKLYGNKAWFSKHVMLCVKSKHETPNNEIQPNYLCGLCRFTSHYVEEVDKHFVDHMKINDLECKMCNFVGIDFAQMFGHRLRHGSSNLTVKPSCPLCKNSSRTKYAMEFHYRSVHLNKMGGYCPKCNLEFSKYVNFRNHMLIHREKKYICDLCNVNFSSRKKILLHLKNHQDPKKFICHECGKRFKRSNYLATHMNTVHVKEDPIKCTHCNKYFKSASTLKHHMKRIFEKKTSLKCDICGKCYVNPCDLKSHKFWHTGERPHCCEICGSRYKAKGQLKIHMQKHIGLRPFKCDSCSKFFPSARELRRHSRVHTGIRPYKCLHCDNTFNTKKQVNKHYAVGHKLFIDEVDKEYIQS